MSQGAYQAERDLNLYQAKTGRGKNISDTRSFSRLFSSCSRPLTLSTILAQESGVDADVENRFPGSEVRVGPGSTASGSDNCVIPPEEGGEFDDRGHVSKARGFLEPNKED
ncbi:hypothetical protein MGYG_05084 [Nannizzia gypsea CBS 118893]|uniref:Uncharacterized protein n=1 Tax=Arthroderma gypseum (strain ATCC MYA-4604 / CBS 118893) TaxID=535722 RepID=E4UYB8_ARTGP|nr:hypothetical protein MGYG_05084 [Nannizzia gypsea CBS 118893]EFR02081.1 hypothetical protein MGYG_05084 [Nannizzia gypsea CBS 118893]